LKKAKRSREGVYVTIEEVLAMSKFNSETQQVFLSMHTLVSSMEHLCDFSCEVLDGIPLIYIITNEEGDIVHFNNYAEKAFKKKCEVVLGTKFIDLVAGRTKTFFESYYYLLQDGPTKEVSAQSFVDIEQKKDSVLWQIKRFRPRKEEAQGIVVLLGNLTEDVQTAIHSEVIQKAKMNTLSYMAGGIAHELNNPLAIIKLLLYKIKKKYKEDEAIFKSASQIEKSVNRCTRIVSDVISLGKNEMLDIQTLEEVNVCEVIEHAYRIIVMIMHDRKIKLKNNITDYSIFVMGDFDKIKMIFHSLLKNAIESFDKIEDDREKHIEISAVKNKGVFSMSVTDNGIGIDDSIKELIFDPFFSTKKVGAGTGLELTVIRNDIQKMGGSIYFNSVVNKGSTFTVDFKLAKKKADE
jgi:signal transduction histidine kinase